MRTGHANRPSDSRLQQPHAEMLQHPAVAATRRAYNWVHMRRELITALAAVATAAALAAQTLNPSARAVINLPRSLIPAEIAQLLAAVREAITGKTVRLAFKPDGPGPELLMAADGRPRFVRAVSGYTSWSGWAANGLPPQTRDEHANVTEVTAFTRQPARRCDGSPSTGELVIEYRQAGGGWTVNTRGSSPADMLRPVFDMLVGLKPLILQQSHVDFCSVRFSAE